MNSYCSLKNGDSLLERINSKYVSLRDKDILRNNEILHQVLKEVVKTLKEKNEFCRAYLRDIMFVGSFYKGTKVGKPEEFDLNVVIQLPLKYELIQFENDKPGLIKLKISKECYKPEWEHHKQFLAKMVTPEGYLNQDEFRRCMESALANMPKTVVQQPRMFDNSGCKIFELKLHKSGPAFTLCVKQQNALEMCLDLIPVLEFMRRPRISGNVGFGKPSNGQNGRNSNSNYRRKRYRQKPNWFAIPKSSRNIADPHLYWRMSFYRDEQILLGRFHHPKPIIRLLKKLRDTQNWKVLVSYHIETLVLHRIEAMNRRLELRNSSLTKDFVVMLRELKTACETTMIVDFWDRSHNLIANVEPHQLENIASRLETMLKKIEEDPTALANFILTQEERQKFNNQQQFFLP